MTATLPTARYRSPASESIGREEVKRKFQPIGPYLTEHQSLANYATLAGLGALSDIVNKLWDMHIALEERMNTLMGADNVSDVIDSYMEMEAFLQGVTNKETLTGLLSDLRAELTNPINSLSTKVADLETALTSRPGLPASMENDGLYVIKNGEYVLLCSSTEQLLAIKRPTA